MYTYLYYYIKKLYATTVLPSTLTLYSSAVPCGPHGARMPMQRSLSYCPLDSYRLHSQLLRMPTTRPRLHSYHIAQK